MLEQPNIRILYDGNCPICCRKVKFLNQHDSLNKLSFFDIRQRESLPAGLTISQTELEKQIHAMLPDGSIVNRMEVIRVAYRAIGLGWLIAPTGWPILRTVFDKLYGFVAENRQRISKLIR